MEKKPEKQLKIFGKVMKVEDSDDEDQYYIQDLLKATEKQKNGEYRKGNRKPDAYEGTGILHFYKDQKQTSRQDQLDEAIYYS